MNLNLLLIFPNIDSPNIMDSYTGNMAKNIHTHLSSRTNINLTLNTSIFPKLMAEEDVSDDLLKMVIANNYDAIMFAGLKPLDRKKMNINFIEQIKNVSPKTLMCQFSDQAVKKN